MSKELNGSVKVKGVSTNDDYRIKIEYPCGKHIVVLIPADDYMINNIIEFGEEYGLNAMMGGHYY